MRARNRLTSLERRFPAPLAAVELEPIVLPTLAEFQTLALEDQRLILLFWQPPPVHVPLPSLEEIPRLPLEELARISDTHCRPGLDILLPYVRSLPMEERIRLARESINLEIWRYKTFRAACKLPSPSLPSTVGQ